MLESTRWMCFGSVTPQALWMLWRREKYLVPCWEFEFDLCIIQPAA